MGGFIANALKSSHEALDNANRLQHAAGGPLHKSEPAASAPSNYSHAREARKSGGSFMGVEADKGPELNAALESHAKAKAALE